MACVTQLRSETIRDHDQEIGITKEPQVEREESCDLWPRFKRMNQLGFPVRWERLAIPVRSLSCGYDPTNCPVSVD
jgi:hypothetical protein